MKGDFTRFTHDPKKYYNRVLKQQGRVDLDADWNEQIDLQVYLDRIRNKDVIGCAGVPEAEKDSFKISLAPEGKDLVIYPGRMYVEGLLCELEGKTYPLDEVSEDGIVFKPRPFTESYFKKGQAFQLRALNKEHFVGYVEDFGRPPHQGKVLLKVMGKIPADFTGSGESQKPDTAVLEPLTSYLHQPYYPDPPPLSPKKDGQADLVFLDVWERHITAHEDPDIREVALGGPDTTTRVKTIWQVKWLTVKKPGTCEELAQELPPALGRGRLCAWVEEEAPPTPCHLAPGSGYQGLENRLYRVEIHEGRNLTGDKVATFKWSRDNGAVVYAIDDSDVSGKGFNVDGKGTKIKVKDLGRDQVLALAPQQWVEVLGDETDLKQEPGTLAQIVDDGIDLARNTITLSVDVSSHQSEGHPKVRRWDQASDAIKVSDEEIPLELGIKIKFSGSNFRPGDYWVFWARTATREIDPSFAEPQPPKGIYHHYAPLALIEWKKKGKEYVTEIKEDLRKVFAPLADPGPQVAGVLAISAHIGPRPLLNGMYLPVNFLANGLQIVFNQNIDPVTTQQEPCFVSLRIPFPLNAADREIWGSGIIGYQPLILAAEVTPLAQRCLSWKPKANTKAMLLDGLPRMVWKGFKTSFERDWEIFDPESLGLSWEYSNDHILVDGYEEATQAPFFAMGSLSMSKEGLEEGCQSLELQAAFADPGDTGNVGLVFNWLSDMDYYVFAFRHFWQPVGYSGAYETLVASIMQVKNGEIKPIYEETVGTGKPEAITLLIRQGEGRLGFSVIIKNWGHELVRELNPNITLANLPKSLLSGLRGGMAARYSGEVKFTMLQALMRDNQRVNIIPEAEETRLLARLTVKLDSVIPKSADKFSNETFHPESVVNPRGDFERWFWLTPPSAPYPYGYGHLGIGGDLI